MIRVHGRKGLTTIRQSINLSRMGYSTLDTSVLVILVHSALLVRNWDKASKMLSVLSQREDRHLLARAASYSCPSNIRCMLESCELANNDS